jgi:two-component system, probable response regulator PhcQ
MNQPIASNLEIGLLFVDDEPLSIKYFVKFFGSDYQVFTASSVKEAIEILEKSSDRIAVVITDQVMPGGNGSELLRVLEKGYPEIVRVLSTAYCNYNELSNEISEAATLHYMQKPWDFGKAKVDLKSLFAVGVANKLNLTKLTN